MHEGPDQTQISAHRIHIHECNYSRVPNVPEISHQSFWAADIPHAPPRHEFESIWFQIILQSRLRSHAAKADFIDHRIRSEHEVLGLALQDALGLVSSENFLSNEVTGQDRRLERMIFHEVAKNLIQPAAVQQIAATQVKNERVTRSQFGRHIKISS